MDVKRQRIMDAFGTSIHYDCFAYDKTNHNCKALDELVCRKGKCPFYKTAKERCMECRLTKKWLTCEECRLRGLK